MFEREERDFVSPGGKTYVRNFDPSSLLVPTCHQLLEAKGWAESSSAEELRRYVNWWTTGNGFFPGASDLAQEAGRLIEVLRR